MVVEVQDGGRRDDDEVEEVWEGDAADLVLFHTLRLL